MRRATDDGIDTVKRVTESAGHFESMVLTNVAAGSAGLWGLSVTPLGNSLRVMRTRFFQLLTAACLACAMVVIPAQSFAQGMRSTAMSGDQRQGHYFTYGGARIFYQDTGKGMPMILIHGYPLSGELFKYQRNPLSKHFRFITIDLPGYGKSSAPNAAGSIEGYAKDVMALMDHLHIQKAIVGGHSMGGVITMELYREMPQRFSGMVLIDTNPKPAPIVGKSEWDAYAKQAREKGIASTVPLLLPVMLTGKTIASMPQKADILKRVVMEASVNGFVAGGHALANRMDYRPTLKTVKVPALIIVGQDDPLWAVPLDQLMHHLIPNSTLSILPGAAHASIFEQPSEANDAIMDWATKMKLSR